MKLPEPRWEIKGSAQSKAQQMNDNRYSHAIDKSVLYAFRFRYTLSVVGEKRGGAMTVEE